MIPRRRLPIRHSLSTALFLLLVAPFAQARQADPLPSWNEGPSKKAIVEFVAAVKKVDGPDFVPVADRIATFDNDGTLWSEQPVYFQLAFAADRLRAVAGEHPEWKDRPIFQAALKGDFRPALAGTVRDRLEIVGASHAGMTSDEFTRMVKEWIGSAKHPRFARPYTELVFQPMLELLAYLRANGFKTYIVSGGGAESCGPGPRTLTAFPPNR